jgi:hypothetical protein
VPPIWRTIQVPGTYSFWDLHVAIQDSMGWLDYHLHLFRVSRPGTSDAVQIGIPDEDAFEGDEPILPGWEVPIASYFTHPGAVAKYEYDFGDGWEHEVTLEAIVPRQKGRRYPSCLAGERACPPEDCGGVGGYEDLMAVMRDPTHEAYESTLRWLGGGRFDPERFDAKAVKFDHPGKRWDLAFGKAVQSRRLAKRAAVIAKPRARPQSRSARTLSSVVSAQTYSVWLEMLHALVPDGRTHRLSIVVAGMLRHALDIAVARFGEHAPEGSAAASLIQAAEEADPEQVADQIGDLVERLFRDAKVAGRRVNARGDEYSILDSAIQEFASWYAMPWE